MRESRFERFAPLTGAVFFLVIVIAVIVGNSDTPDVDAPAREIASFYRDNKDSGMSGDGLGVIAGGFLVWFAASLRGAIARVEGGQARLAALTFGGGLLAAAGAWSVFGLDFAVYNAADKASPATLQALHALNDGFFFPLAGGFGLFMLAAGLALLRTRALPVVAAWLAIAIGIVTFTPVGFFGVLATLIWVPVASVMLYRLEGTRVVQAAAAPTAPAV